jgi:hypothetical protein
MDGLNQQTLLTLVPEGGKGDSAKERKLKKAQRSLKRITA